MFRNVCASDSMFSCLQLTLMKNLVQDANGIRDVTYLQVIATGSYRIRRLAEDGTSAHCNFLPLASRVKDPNYYRSTVHTPQNIAKWINMVFDEITQMGRFCNEFPIPRLFLKSQILWYTVYPRWKQNSMVSPERAKVNCYTKQEERDLQG